MADKNSPIGVFDSGLGGLSVLKELLKVCPKEDFIYFGDSKNAPYGTRSKEDVKKLTYDAVNFLLSKDCKAICIACNTATSAAVKQLRIDYPALPLVGIEPAIKPAALSKDYPNILVMATPMTIAEEKFQSLLARFEDQANIIQLPCPGLMEFIEKGILSGKELESFLKTLLKDYIDTNLDCVVLGCTHYPFVAEQIKNVLGGNVTLFDGSLGTAKELFRRIREANLVSDRETKGSVTILNSDASHIPLSNHLLFNA